jgi:hypothetical protein
MSDSNAWGDLPAFDRPSSGSWLYQHAGNLYGPLLTEVLLDRIRKGKLPESIVVCEDGRDDFVPITEHPVLKEEAQKAFIAAKALRARQAREQKEQVRKTVIFVLLGLFLIAASGGGYYGYRYLERQKAAEAQRRQADADAMAAKKLQDEERKKRDAALALAAAAQKDDVDLDLDLLPLVSVTTKKKPPPGKRGKKASEVDEGPQGCQLDQGSITTTFRSGFGSIKSCVRDQSSRGEALPETLTLSFTISNNGTVASFETDNRSIRNGPFFDCLKRVVTGLHFPKFPGERCNIDYPITIGKKK